MEDAKTKEFGKVVKKRPPHLVVSVYVANQVLEQIQRSGYSGLVSYLQGTMLYAKGDAWEPYEKHLAELEETFRQMSDEKSRATVIGYLNFMRTCDDGYLKEIIEKSQGKLLEAYLLIYRRSPHLFFQNHI